MSDHELGPITSLQNPRIKSAVRLRDRRHRDRENRFRIEGFREVLRAVQSGLPLDELFYSSEHFLGDNEPSLIDQAVAECGALAVEVAKSVFEKLSYRDRPDGLIATAPIPNWDLANLEAKTSLPSNPLILVVQAIEKPGNLGTMLRTADASGVDAVIVCDHCTDLWNPNVVRASVGTLFTVPVAHGESETVRLWLQSHQVSLVTTTPDAKQLHWQADMKRSVALVIGSEQYGLDQHWLAKSDQKIRIPMHGDADSLNAAVAAAVVLFEALRQRS